MKKILWSAALLAVMTASCTNEEVLEQNNADAQLFTVNAVQGVQSRTTMGDGDVTLWSEGDQIFVCSEDGKVSGILTLTKGAGSNQAEFTGMVSGDPSKLEYSVFPVPGNDGTISMATRSGDKLNAPMIGTLDGNSVGFANAGGLIKMIITGAEEQSVKVTSTADESTDAGHFGGSYKAEKVDGKWTLTYTAGNGISINNIPENGVIYVPVNAGTTKTEITVAVTIGEGENATTITKEVNVQQGNITQEADGEVTFPEMTVNGEGTLTELVEVKTSEEITTAVADGKSVRLMNSITLDGTALVVEKEVVIDLNGKMLTGGLFAESNGTISAGTSDSYAIWVKEGGHATITGDGSVEAQAATYSIAVWALGGTAVIENGAFANAGEGSDLIYAKDGGTITIYDGTFKACEKQEGVSGTANKYSALNLRDNTNSEITVYGGRFYKFDPSVNKSENPTQNFVADGYSVTQDGDYYVVSAGSK